MKGGFAEGREKRKDEYWVGGREAREIGLGERRKYWLGGVLERKRRGCWLGKRKGKMGEQEGSKSRGTPPLHKFLVGHNLKASKDYYIACLYGRRISLNSYGPSSVRTSRILQLVSKGQEMLKTGVTCFQ